MRNTSMVHRAQGNCVLMSPPLVTAEQMMDFCAAPIHSELAAANATNLEQSLEPLLILQP